MADNENGHHEPTSPSRVAADMLVVIILLAGAFAAETIKESIPHGVPLVITVILTVSELTLAVYFIVVLARAFGYAFREIDKVRESVEGTRSGQMSKRSLAALLSALRGALPSGKDFGRALRFGIRLMAAFAFVGAALLIVVNYDLAAGGDSGDGPERTRHAPAGSAETIQDRGSFLTGDHEATQPAPQRSGLTREISDAPAGEPAATQPGKPTRATSTAEGNERSDGQESRAELERQLKQVEQDSALLERRRAELKRSLEGRVNPAATQAKARATQAHTFPKRTGRHRKHANHRAGIDFPDRQSDAGGREFPKGGASEPFPNDDNTLESEAHHVFPATRGDEEVVNLGYGRPQLKSTLAAALFSLAQAVQNYRLHIVVGALAAALLTLIASLTALARRAAGEEA